MRFCIQNKELIDKLNSINKHNSYDEKIVEYNKIKDDVRTLISKYTKTKYVISFEGYCDFYEDIFTHFSEYDLNYLIINLFLDERCADITDKLLKKKVFERINISELNQSTLQHKFISYAKKNNGSNRTKFDNSDLDKFIKIICVELLGYHTYLKNKYEIVEDFSSLILNKKGINETIVIVGYFLFMKIFSSKFYKGKTKQEIIDERNNIHHQLYENILNTVRNNYSIIPELNKRISKLKDVYSNEIFVYYKDPPLIRLKTINNYKYDNIIKSLKNFLNPKESVQPFSWEFTNRIAEEKKENEFLQEFKLKINKLFDEQDYTALFFSLSEEKDETMKNLIAKQIMESFRNKLKQMIYPKEELIELISEIGHEDEIKKFLYLY